MTEAADRDLPALQRPRWLPSAAVGRFLLLIFALALVAQSFLVVKARPQDLITGIAGMADIIQRAWPPDFSQFPDMLRPTLETVDIALFGSVMGVVLAVPLAILAARNMAPAKFVYYGARGLIAFTRAVPELVWALVFVAAVGLGPFPGALALMLHSMGMLARLFAEVIEDMDMGPVEALTVSGAGRLQIFAHAVVPGVLPSLLGVSLYRLDENLRSSVVLGFVGAGGIGFQVVTAMSLFQYRTVSMLMIIILVLVLGAERFSAWLRGRIL